MKEVLKRNWTGLFHGSRHDLQTVTLQAGVSLSEGPWMKLTRFVSVLVWWKAREVLGFGLVEVAKCILFQAGYLECQRKLFLGGGQSLEHQVSFNLT